MRASFFGLNFLAIIFERLAVISKGYCAYLSSCLILFGQFFMFVEQHGGEVDHYKRQLGANRRPVYLLAGIPYSKNKGGMG